MKDLMTALLFLVGVPVYPEIHGGFLVSGGPTTLHAANNKYFFNDLVVHECEQAL